MSLIDRISKADAVLSMVDRLVSWGPILYSLVVGWLSAVVAVMTPGLDAYAPFIWLLAAFLGAAVFLGLYALLQVLLLWKAKADRYKAAPPPTAVNPLDNSFDKARIRFLDFADPVTRIVEGKTFVDCEFYGPATVVFSGCSFDGWRGAIDCDFVVLRADQETFAFSNVIMVKNSFFKNCKFLKLVLLFNKSTKDDLDRLSRGAIKWITNP